MEGNGRTSHRAESEGYARALPTDHYRQTVKSSKRMALPKRRGRYRIRVVLEQLLDGKRHTIQERTIGEEKHLSEARERFDEIEECAEVVG